VRWKWVEIFGVPGFPVSFATHQPFRKEKSLHVLKRFRKYVSGVSDGGFARAPG